jgi:hypothetical protein
MKKVVRNTLIAGSAVVALSLFPAVADAHGGGHMGGGHMGGAHMGGAHFAGGHRGHFAGGYRGGYGGGGYYGGYCGPVQIAAGLCGPYGY